MERPHERFGSAGELGTLSLESLRMKVPIRSMTFWINAFIPKEITNYTRIVPSGPHKGKTMIPGPHKWSDCFLTDQRMFSNDIQAKSRMHSEFRIEFTGKAPSLAQNHRCDLTTECDCEDGDVECEKHGNTSRMGFVLVPATASVSDGKPRAIDARVRMECAASNPCAASSRLFGDIDYVGEILIDLEARALEFRGKIDAFPAFEAYATINDGEGVALFQILPPPGNTVMNLPGRANRRVAVRIADSTGLGTFNRVIEL